MTHPTLIGPDEIPDRWGLLWVYPQQIRVVRKAECFSARDAAHAERQLLVSALRRVALRGDLDRICLMPDEEAINNDEEERPA